MADPVMSDLPLRRVLKYVKREYLSRSEVFRAYALENPLEAWIHFSNKARQAVFQERREEEFETALLTLKQRGYICSTGPTREHPENSYMRLSRPTTFYRLTETGKQALLSIKR